MRKNLRRLSNELVWEYLNSTLLKEVDEGTLNSHNISLPISKSTALKWMKKCKAEQCGTKKTYYNDQHQKPDVIAHRDEYIKMLESLRYRMRVWVILSAAEEAKYLEFRWKSPLLAVMPVGEEITIDGIVKYVHHIDDHGGWEADPVFHPHFKPELLVAVA